MRLSVIIPTLNEETHLPQTLASLPAQTPDEIIVADGGSTDATLSVAQGRCDRIVEAPRGRAHQMNHGAAVATGDVLLFLHADCLLERGALAEARALAAQPSVAAGCFRMRVRSQGWLYRSIDGCASARVRLSGLIYGDQGMFLRRDMFDRVGGFPSLRLMEDVFISRRLRQLGRVVVGRKRIFVSPRRWQQQGIIRQTLRNWTLTALAAAGVSPDWLSRFYPIVR